MGSTYFKHFSAAFALVHCREMSVTKSDPVLWVKQFEMKPGQ